MTGEVLGPVRGAATQPGGRPPAPGRLALVQAFINSHYDLEDEHGAELIGTPERLAAWLAARSLVAGRVEPTPSDLRRALALRETLRSLAYANADPDADADGRTGADGLSRLGAAAGPIALELTFDADRPMLAGGGRGTSRGLDTLLAITAESMLTGTWSRLKACPGPDCGWAFYDNSRNRTGRWCSMAVCGGRAKARAHYRRRRERG